MFELFTQLILEWIAKFRTPMSDPARRHWEGTRRRGVLFYLMLWSLGVGGLLFALEIGWDLLVDHIRIDEPVAVFFAVGYVLFGLILGAVNWQVNKNRYGKSKAS